MRISDWSSDVCSSDLHSTLVIEDVNSTSIRNDGMLGKGVAEVLVHRQENEAGTWVDAGHDGYARRFGIEHRRSSEEHTSELQSLMSISSAVFCLKKKTVTTNNTATKPLSSNTTR